MKVRLLKQIHNLILVASVIAITLLFIFSFPAALAADLYP